MWYLHEVFEALAAKLNVEQRLLDDLPAHEGALDVLAQHIVGRAVAGPFSAEQLYKQVCSAAHFNISTRSASISVIDLYPSLLAVALIE